MGIAKRGIIAASLAAFLAYYLVGMGMAPGLLPTMLKGAGVALLTVLALSQGRGVNGQMLTAVMALGSAGDMAIESSRTVGAGFFLVGHLVAVCLYWRNRREITSASQNGLEIALLIAIPLIAFAMPSDRALASQSALYALALSAMAAAAWTSRFSRYSVGIGAMLFVASDLLIFARMGPLAQSQLPGMLIWPLYYAGQYLICFGVLRGDHAVGNSTEPSAPR